MMTLMLIALLVGSSLSSSFEWSQIAEPTAIIDVLGGQPPPPAVVASTELALTKEQQPQQQQPQEEQQDTPLKKEFRGARDANGNFGYVHDATHIRKLYGDGSEKPQPWKLGNGPNDLSYQDICAPPGMGLEGTYGYQALTEKIQIANTTSTESFDKNGPKIMCVLYSYQGGSDKVQAIVETWGRRCDGFLAMSNTTQPEIGFVDIAHGGPHHSGDYGSVWQRVRAIYAYLYHHYLDEYDFFHICGDDVYLIVENLRAYVRTLNPNDIVYVGQWTHPTWLVGKEPGLDKEFYYAGGGPGYTLSRRALKEFVEKALLTCQANRYEAKEDFFVGWCMREVLGTRPGRYRDRHGQPMYHGFDVDLSVAWNFRTTNHFHSNLAIFHKLQQKWMRRRFQQALLYGLEGVSAHSVSFHECKVPNKIRRIEKILYRPDVADCTCDGGTNEPGSLPLQQSHQEIGDCTHVWFKKNHRYILQGPDCPKWRKEQMRVQPPHCDDDTTSTSSVSS